MFSSNSRLEHVSRLSQTTIVRRDRGFEEMCFFVVCVAVAFQTKCFPSSHTARSDSEHRRFQDSIACNKAVHHLLREGRPRQQTALAGRAHRTVDFSALRFFVELAQYEGYSGRGIDNAMKMLDGHMAEVLSSSWSMYKLSLPVREEYVKVAHRDGPLACPVFVYHLGAFFLLVFGGPKFLSSQD